MRSALRTFALLAATAVLVTGASGCGSEETPAEAVPEIASRLERVDAAIEAENYGRAREAVEALVEETEQAREDTTLSDERADLILQAASSLLSRLPEEGSDELLTPDDDGLPTDLADPDVEPDEPDPPPADDGEEDGDQGEGHDDKPDPSKDKDKDENKDEEKDKEDMSEDSGD